MSDSKFVDRWPLLIPSKLVFLRLSDAIYRLLFSLSLGDMSRQPSPQPVHNSEVNGASSSSAAFNSAGPNNNTISAANVFWPPHQEVDNTFGLNSDSNSVPFWPAPPGQVDNGIDVANINLSIIVYIVNIYCIAYHSTYY